MSDGVIGSIGVAVVPDAENFWRRFEEQTRAGAVKAGRDLGRSIRAGIEEEVGRTEPDVRVGADTREAQARLAALRAEIARAGGSIRIGANTSSAAAHVAALTAATNRLTDAQGAASLARQKLEELQAKGNVPAIKLAAATEAVARADRSAELAALKLAAAQEAVVRAENQSAAAAVRAATAQAAAAARTEAAAARAAAAAARIEERNAQAAAKAGQSNKQFGLLYTSVVTLGPALIPIAGAAAAVGAAFVGAGAAGVLALKGVQAEIKAGTALGNQFSGRLGVLKTDLAGIEHATVAATAGAFGRAEQKINAAVPQLSADLGRLAAITGDIVQHLVGGLVTGLHTFEPLMQHVLLATDQLAARFESWATGPGGAKFAATLSADFDQVVPILGDLVVTVGHLVAAFAPIGGQVLTSIGALSAVLNEIPIPVLRAGATAFVAFTIASKVAFGINAAAVALNRFAAAEAAAGAAGGVGGRGAGILGGALARAVPYAAVYTGLTIGANSAAKATEDWAGSQNNLQASLHATAVVAKDFLSLHWNKLPADFSHGKDDHNAAVKAQADVNYAFTPAKLQTQITQSQNAALQTQLVLRQQLNSVPQTGTGSALGAGPALGNITGNAQSLVAIKHNTEYYQQQLNMIQGISRKYSNAIFTINAANDSALLHQLSKAPIDQAAGSFARLTSGLQTQIDAEKVWTDVGKKGSVTIDGVKYSVDAYNKALEQTGGDTSRAVGVLQGHTLALEADEYAMKVAQLQQARLNAAVGEAEGKYRLTGEQVSTYAALVGITSDQVATGAVTTKQFSDAIGVVSKAVANGTTAVDGLVAAVAAFQSGADTAASRATLIGQTLIAANGDALAYAGTMNQAAQANAALVASLDIATGATTAATRATIDLKTGTIDYSSAAAGPLLSALQGVQTAAGNAAAATYQHELQTRGATKAADDAYATYVSQTRGQLIEEAGKLGLTGDQAKRLADQYFGLANADDIKKNIELIGQDRVYLALQGIIADLDIISGKSKFQLEVDTAFAAASLRSFAANLPAGIRASFIAANSANGNIFDAYANGGISKFASGSENHVAQIAPAGLRLWAEPETGGEAYIPLAQSKRARSLDILAQVASRFGYQPKPYNNGAASNSAKSAPGVVNNHWNINEATDASSVAYEVSRRQWMAAAV